MSRILSIFLLFYFNLSFAQSDQYFSNDRGKYCIIDGSDTIKVRPKLSFGSRHSGIGFGNFRNYNGLRFSVYDWDSLTNGISINLYTIGGQYKTTNGIEFSFLGSSIGKLNGVVFGSIYNGYIYANGLVLGGIMNDGVVISGIQVTGLISMTYELNGLSISGVTNIAISQNGVLIAGLINRIDSITNGLTVCGLLNNTENFNGVCISPVNIAKKGKGFQIGLFNKAENLKGVQLGIININKRNKFMKFFPFINLSFRKEKE